MLALIAVGVATVYEIAASFDGPHWSLEDDETIALSKAIDAAIDTLPGEYYAYIRKFLEQQFPWLTLAVVAGKVTLPRWNESRAKRGGAKPDKANNPAPSETVSGNAGDSKNGAGSGVWNHYRAESSFRSGLS